MKIRFGTDGWRAIIAREYTTENVARVSKATADWLKEADKPSVVIGYDCRFGGPMFAEVAARMLCSQGVRVYFAHETATTPMVSLACLKLGTTAGVVITASHNPPDYNGYKLKSHYGGPTTPNNIARVESLIPDRAELTDTTLQEFESDGSLEYVDLTDMYRQHVEQHFDMEAIRNSGWVIAYDAMWGAGKDIVCNLLPDAIALHCGNNPGFEGQAPEPLHRNLGKLSTLIKTSTDIDFGFANDGDADRIGVYDENGVFVDSHHVILLLIVYLVRHRGMNGKVVVSFSVSGRVKKLCDHLGLECLVTKIGFKYICEIMISDDVLVGAEESGGIAVKGHIPERDGVWNALLLLEFMTRTNKSLTELIAEVYSITGAFSFDRDDLHISDDLKQDIISRCQGDGFETFGPYKVSRTEQVDGFKYHLGEEAWVMIRPSGTEPVLRVYAESTDPATVRSILDAARQTLTGT